LALPPKWLVKPAEIRQELLGRLVTYMATIAELEATGDLLPYDPDFEADEFPSRWVHLAPVFAKWQETVLPRETSDRGLLISPLEQVEQRLYEYCLGRPMIYDRDRKILEPQSAHVWQIKTPDARLFGWLPARRHFIAVCGEMKSRLLHNDNYKPFIAQVIAFRNALNLNAPKYLTGVFPRDIC
jgi:hypothetical protein